MARSRKENLAAFHRNTILEAANALFLKKGIAGGTMDEIAKEAGYSKSTVYVYFRSKDDIVYHLVYEGMGHLLQRLEQADTEAVNFKDFFLKACWAVSKIHDDFPVYFEGITGRISLESDGVERQIDTGETILQRIYRRGEEINALVRSRVQRAVDHGELPSLDDLSERNMVIWFFLAGVVEKSSQKENYINNLLKINRKQFLEYSFDMLFRLLE